MKTKDKNSLERSRIMATAVSLGTAAVDRHVFIGKAVLLTGEPAILATANGRECLLDSLRLLVRMVERLTVRVPRGPEMDVICREAERISYRNQPLIEPLEVTEMAGFDAILCVGATGRSDLPWTVVNSNGWLARVSSLGESISPICTKTNPIGALGAACLGVAEVFKRLIALLPERGQLCPGMSFSFHEYRETDVSGPDLPQAIAIDAALFGVGAIGNGIVRLLSALPVVGTLVAVDKQAFQEENWGTCFAIGPGEMGVAKAEWASNLLRSRLATKWLRGSVEDYIAECGKAYHFPRLVLNGLDNILARRAVQDLWPDQIIDGAIGPTMCEVTLHPWESALSCLKCDFEEPAADALDIQIRSSGLLASRILEPAAVIGLADVAAAPAERQPWLRTKLGKPICSVVSESVLAALSGEAQAEGFEPSAPFVACLSACMVVTEMIRFCLGWPTILETGYQFDSLVGPQNGLFKAHRRKMDCECLARRRNIYLMRSHRSAGGDGILSVQA